LILEAEADLVPMGPRSPLRSGRRRADIPRMSCAPSSAWLRLLWGRCPWFKVSPPARSLQNRRPPGRLATRLPQGFGCCVAGAHGSKVSAPLRSLQNRRPPDVLQPIFRTLSSALKWGKLNYTDFVQNCILDQKERTSL
jgi:hypothetical protein